MLRPLLTHGVIISVIKKMGDMKITVVNGTPLKGVTYHMKEMFLNHLRDGNEITEFYPDDLPGFCLGCKTCFFKGEHLCPHAAKTMPVWNAMLDADLLVFAYPVYALRAPGSVKSLLDHLCVHWMVHRPDERIFTKTAVIITNSVGAPNGAAQRDVKTSLSWLGVSHVYTCGAGMMGDILWDKMTGKHKNRLERKTARLYRKARDPQRHKNRKIMEKLKFTLCKFMHQAIYNSETVPSLDNLHYLEHGWIRPKPKAKA
jgi:multimeric flavodoxin WrbA